MSGTAIVSGERVTRVISGARAALAARADEVNDLNVFPVADGDTGTNMLLTTVAVEEAAAATTSLPRRERCAALSRAALMGSRGNSGMILSQLVRGAAEAFADGDGPLDAAALARALRAASDAAYAAVRVPVEGTMLSVARRIAEAAEAAADDPAQDLAGALDAALAGGRRGVEETPDLLPVLRDAGVVDSGGLGVAILLEGLAAALTGRPPPPPIRVSAPRAPAVGHLPSRYRYCTSFLVEGRAIDFDALEAALAPVGDSVLVMGDATQTKVHVHTDAPERAAALAGAFGAVDGLRWEDMRRQEAERAARLSHRDEGDGAACAALAIADGEGARELLAGLGARALAPTAGPDALAAALAGVGATEVVVVVAGSGAGEALTAARAMGRVEVVGVASVAAALSCLVEFDPAEGALANAARMRASADEVAVASVEGSGEALRPALATALAPLLADRGPALVTVLVGLGAGVDPAVVEGWVREMADDDVEVEAHLGGQSAPSLAIGVE